METPLNAELDRDHLKENAWPWATPEVETAMQGPEALSWPKITIVTPSYNQVTTIEQTIRSVIYQGYPNLEYIIMDGGSTDRTVEVIKKYESYLTYWASEKDRGQSHAINKGWQMATGDLIAWLNSDDYFAPGALKEVAVIYNQCKHQNVGLIYGRANIIDPQGTFLGTFGEPYNLQFALSNMLDPFPQPSTFITKKSLDETGLVDESLHYAMDFDLFLRNAMIHPPVFVENIWSYIHYTPATKTSSNPQGFVKDHFVLLEKILGDPQLKAQAQPFQKAAYASNYLRGVRISLEERDFSKAAQYFLRAIRADAVFTVRKVVKTAVFGRYRKLKTAAL